MHVFLSSTATDLLAHRHAATQAIQQVGMTALDVVEERTRLADLAITSQIALQTADIFVGIYASIYGDLLNDDTRSLIELAYLEAYRLGLPRLLYVVHPHEGWALEHWHVGYRGAMMRMFMDRLYLYDHVLRYFTDPDDLAQKITFDLARFKLEAPRKTPYNRRSVS